jgi:RNA polymerase sigma factor (sigma-70 family)
MAVIAASSPVRQLRVMPLRTLSDERLAELAGIGHSDAFGTLYERYRDALARYCRSIVRDPEDAGDALQNTMVSVLRALKVRGPAGPLRPWMYRIAHNEAISILRRRHSHEELSVETPDRVDTELASFAKQRLESLLSDLRALPERQRGALVMRELGGLEYGEIGDALGMSAVSARKHVFEARVALNDIAAGRDADCADIVRRISDGDGRALRARSIRGHLRGCPSCSAFERGVRTRRGTFALLPGLPVLTSGALLTAVLHGGGGVASSSGFGMSGSVLGGSVAGGSVATGAMAAGSLVGGGSLAAFKGLVAAGAIAVAGAGVIVGTGLSSHTQPQPKHSAAVTRRAHTRHAHRVARAAPAAVKRAHVRLLPPPPPPPALPKTHHLAAASLSASAAPAPAATSSPKLGSSSAPNAQAPTTAVPVSTTAPVTTTTPSAPPSSTGTASTPTGAPATSTPSTTSWVDALIQNTLQFAGANVAAVEAQAAQSLSLAGAAPGSQAATSLVQGIISTVLSGGH